MQLCKCQTEPIDAVSKNLDVFIFRLMIVFAHRERIEQKEVKVTSGFRCHSFLCGRETQWTENA